VGVDLWESLIFTQGSTFSITFSDQSLKGERGGHDTTRAGCGYKQLWEWYEFLMR
jgi:hypothetical protein